MNPLKEGEVVCNKCNGTGNFVKKNDTPYAYFPEIPITCNKCQGDGKLDWIENIVGKPKKDFHNNVDFSTEYFMKDYEIDPELLKDISNQMRDNIDKKVLDSLINGNWDIKNESYFKRR